MKPLIYTVAIGKECIEQAQLMIESLRTFGKYEGYIWVYGDGETEFPGATAKSLVGYDELSEWPHFHRALVGAYEDLSGFDKIMYVDADVIFVAPVECFLEYGNPVACFEEKELVDGMERHYLERGAVPIPGMYGLNSGTIVADADLWRDVCKEWLKESRRIKAQELRCKDQHSWNTMSFKKAICVLPRNWVWFSGELNQQMTLSLKMFHCNGANKFWLMRTLLEVWKTHHNLGLTPT